jgi:hypothetical protein
MARLGTVAAFCVAGLALVSLIWSVPTNQQAALYLFHSFVPLHGLVGVLAIIAAGRIAWGHPPPDLPERFGALGLCLLSWWHDAFRAQVRRAADMSGYADAIKLETNDYRVFSGAVLVVTALIALRAFTRRRFGEKLWVAVACGWFAIVMFGSEYIRAGLTWIYTVVAA